MKVWGLTLIWVLAAVSIARGGEDFFDRLDEALSVSGWNDHFRARISGTLDLEAYALQQPAPALLDSKGHELFVPRLAVFLDAQLGGKIYVFAQARIDRGFDPSSDALSARADEYAVRFTPWEEGRLNFQVGKFATFVGNWNARHDSWGNAFVTAPLPYENLTGLWDAAAARSSSQLLEWAHVRPGPFVDGQDKYLRLPIIWGPSYAMGAAIFGRMGKLRYALETKQSALSSRPEVWTDNTAKRWEYPTVSSHLGWQPNPKWNVGVSASFGSYLRPSAERTLAPGHGFGDYRQFVWGQDTTFAWRHLQVWTEIYATRFEIPLVGHADTLAYYVEAKYKFTPQFFGAVRWNQQVYGDINQRGIPTPWGRDVWRIDLALGYRFTAHTQLKLQYSLQHESSSNRELSLLVALQFTIRF